MYHTILFQSSKIDCSAYIVILGCQHTFMRVILRAYKNAGASHIHISTSNVSVVPVNGHIIHVHVGSPTLSSYDVMRFGARARSVEPCKDYVTACFGAF